jgi:hypothetical protein
MLELRCMTVPTWGIYTIRAYQLLCLLPRYLLYVHADQAQLAGTTGSPVAHGNTVKSKCTITPI